MISRTEGKLSSGLMRSNMHGLLCDTCHAPTSSSHLFVSLQVRTPPPPWLCQLEVFPHLLCKEDCVLGLRCWGMQGRAGESGTLCLGNRHPHARTCFHSVKCVLDHGKVSFQTVLGCTDLPSL